MGQAAAGFDYILTGRTVSQISARIHGKPYSCIPLAVNKFDSDRKRMSIIIKEGSKISLLVKGADSAMLHRGVCDTDQEARSMVQHLGEFAQEGLRTLVVGIRELSVREFEDWFQRYKKASLSKQNVYIYHLSAAKTPGKYVTSMVSRAKTSTRRLEA